MTESLHCEEATKGAQTSAPEDEGLWVLDFCSTHPMAQMLHPGLLLPWDPDGPPQSQAARCCL